ncbi:hypothetical protein HK105_207649 [Polyrhizophydium stewartii]|uniref:Copper acquisition factor BIM1-like domain-containing protein n=1 Tax=Polyrhizophydium stewartii TaxID=2732419 RepID=A0ABR4N015_9FUNG|nr:hypothetical protein HK105_000947 [Polyrhizophydium stewartii]
MQLTTILAALAAAASVSAHFTVTTPPSRGFDELIEDQAPCGGFNTPSTTRTTFGKDSNVTIRLADDSATTTVRIGYGSNPKKFKSLVGSASFTSKGVYNIPFNLHKVPRSQSGKPATVQITISGDDGVLYQCSDVILKL